MTTGSQSDIQARLFNQLPPWFNDSNTIINSLLSGVAAVFSWAYSLVAYVTQQMLIGTATDGFLDMAALDFFGGSVQRLSGQTDANFRTWIQGALLGTFSTSGMITTRAGMINALTVITGRAPIFYEPQRTSDTGAYDGPSYFDIVGNMGDYIPNQIFILAYRPLSGSGQYGVTDAQIYAFAAAAAPAGVQVWVQLSN